MKKILFLFAAVGLFSFASCESTTETRSENAGDRIENDAEEVGDKFEKRTEEAGDEIEEAAEGTERRVD